MRSLPSVAVLVLLLPLGAGRASGGPVTLRIDGPASVGRYERIDFEAGGGLPLDPGDVDVTLELETPSGKRLVLPAFHVQPYETPAPGAGAPTGWFYPSGPPCFRARFAPAEVGEYRARAVLQEKSGRVESAPVSFQCVPSPRKGYVRVSARDPRYLELDDGTPFFPIGQNVAFIGESQYVTPSKVEGVFRKMAENGANYARVWACCEDWAMAIEARKSAWGRSWAWKPPFAPAPGDGSPPATAIRIGGGGPAAVSVSPSHRVALRPRCDYVLSGLVWTEGDTALALELRGARQGDPIKSRERWADFKRSFRTGDSEWWLPSLELRAVGEGAVFVRKLSLEEAKGGPELLWEADLDRPIRGHFNQPDSFLLDNVIAAAEKHGLRLQLVLITRDLYMKTLSDGAKPEYGRAVEDAKRLLRYAVARWGWSPNVAGWEYFNEMDPGLPTDRAYREWGEYLERIDIYRHLRSTSAWGPAPKDWAHPQLDMADLHWYLRPAWGDLSKDAAAAALDRARFLRERAPRKPAILGEFGLATNEWRDSPYMDQDREWIHFHNALWASALSGLSGAALFWWWDHLDRGNAYSQYRGISRFTAGVSFAGLSPLSSRSSGGACRVIGLGGKSCAYLWIQDLQSTWWKGVVEKTAPKELEGERVDVEGLAPGSCRVEWWNTYEGKVFKEETAEITGPSLQLGVPPFTRDVAVKIFQALGAK